MLKKKQANFIFIATLLFCTSCYVQYGPKVAFSCDAGTQIGGDENQEKGTINGLFLWLTFNVFQTDYHKKNPLYRIGFLLQPTKTAKEHYTQFTIKDVQITGTSGKNYQSIADKFFPATEEVYNQRGDGYYYTDWAFPFSFEELFLTFTIEVETIDSIESKTFEYHASAYNNPPEPFWEHMWR